MLKEHVRHSVTSLGEQVGVGVGVGEEYRLRLGVGDQLSLPPTPLLAFLPHPSVCLYPLGKRCEPGLLILLI